MSETTPPSASAAWWHSILAVLFTGQLLVVCNILLVPPVLPFIAADLGLTPWHATLLLAAFPAVSLLMNLTVGPTADRVGILVFFRVGLVLAAACFIASALAPSGAALILMRFLSGLAFPMIGITTFALAAATFPKPKVTPAISRISATASLGPLIILPFGTLFADVMSWRIVFAILAAVAILVFAGSFLMRVERATAPGGRAAPQSNRSDLLRHPQIRRILLAYFLQSFGFFTIVAVFPSFVTATFAETGIRITIFAVGGLGGLFGAGLIGRVLKDRSPIAIAAGAASAMVPLSFFLPIVTSVVLAICVVWALFSMLRQIVMALLIAFCNTTCHPKNRATVNSLMNVAFQLGSLVGAFVAGPLFYLDPSFWTLALSGASMFFATAVVLTRGLSCKTPLHLDDAKGHRHAKLPPGEISRPPHCRGAPRVS